MTAVKVWPERVWLTSSCTRECHSTTICSCKWSKDNCQGRLIFVPFLYAIIHLYFMLCRLYMNLLAVFSWTLIGPSFQLYTSGGKVYFGLRPFSLLYLTLSLVVRLHITPLLTVARLFSFPSSSCSCWKILRCVTILIIVRFMCCDLWIDVTHIHHSYMLVIRPFVRFD